MGDYMGMPRAIEHTGRQVEETDTAEFIGEMARDWRRQKAKDAGWGDGPEGGKRDRE
jgi:hypothetical protein